VCRIGGGVTQLRVLGEKDTSRCRPARVDGGTPLPLHRYAGYRGAEDTAPGRRKYRRPANPTAMGELVADHGGRRRDDSCSEAGCFNFRGPFFPFLHKVEQESTGIAARPAGECHRTRVQRCLAGATGILPLQVPGILRVEGKCSLKNSAGNELVASAFA
jgi:hypothetical protein